MDIFIRHKCGERKNNVGQRWSKLCKFVFVSRVPIKKNLLNIDVNSNHCAGRAGSTLSSKSQETRKAAVLKIHIIMIGSVHTYSSRKKQ